MTKGLEGVSAVSQFDQATKRFPTMVIGDCADGAFDVGAARASAPPCNDRSQAFRERQARPGRRCL